jgi:hypothetical protein
LNPSNELKEMRLEKSRGRSQVFRNTDIEERSGTAMGANAVAGSEQMRENVELETERPLLGKLGDQLSPEEIHAGID